MKTLSRTTIIGLTVLYSMLMLVGAMLLILNKHLPNYPAAVCFFSAAGVHLFALLKK